MADESEPLTDDPEIAALLDFEPVERKCKRHDGWTPDNQRRYIVGLAETGNPELAAHPLGRTMSGAYKVRTSAGGEGFAEAWDKALALHLRRNPRLSKGRPSRGEILAGTGRRPWPEAAPAPAAEPAPDEDSGGVADSHELLEGILRKYWLKVGQERRCRLEGRIVEADFYVRQLTWLEVVLDLGGKALELLKAMERGGSNAIDIVATPMSLLLAKVRRMQWMEKGEADRPELPALGDHDDEVSTGPPMECQHIPERDGDFQGWPRRSDEAAAVAAEAQKAWEEKARAEAEAWARREADKPQSSPGFPGEGDQAKPGGGASMDEASDPEPSP
ncbi:MAG TPA: hypothetical protein VEX35_01790 [Allosphingosinicella sp.]|nr:hypothetical protein [Allosphingosinicella sp.]